MQNFDQILFEFNYIQAVKGKHCTSFLYIVSNLYIYKMIKKTNVC